MADQTADYIAQQRAAGLTDQQISAALLSAGWTAEQVAAVLPAPALVPNVQPAVGNPSPQPAPAAFPPELAGWNWGAFLLGWIWGVFNGAPISLIVLIPILGQIAALPLAIYLGIKGNELAWRHRPTGDFAEFKRIQGKWAFGAAVWYLIQIALGVLIGTVLAPRIMELNRPPGSLGSSPTPLSASQRALVVDGQAEPWDTGFGIVLPATTRADRLITGNSENCLYEEIANARGCVVRDRLVPESGSYLEAALEYTPLDSDLDRLPTMLTQARQSVVIAESTQLSVQSGTKIVSVGYQLSAYHLNDDDTHYRISLWQKEDFSAADKAAFTAYLMDVSFVEPTP